jgi:tetratricopeptide (TPR) repeat protein
MLATTYYNQGQYDQAKIWCLKGCKIDQLPIIRNIHMNWLHAMLFETPVEEIKYLNQLLEIDDQSPAGYYELGRIFVSLAQYDKAIPVMIKAFEIYKKWGSKPRWVQDYIMLGYAYQETKRYGKEKKLFKKASKDFPDDPELLYRRAVLALSLENSKDADRLIEEFVSVSKGNFASEANIAWSLGDIYWDADLPDKAEAKFRESLSLEPGNLRRLNYFAYFLIDNDRNIDEALRLTDTALQQDPDNYYFLHTYGWGQYKLGKYQEALDLLQKSWDVRREKAVYNHDAFLHLEAAKKAVINQKNN